MTSPRTTRRGRNGRLVAIAMIVLSVAIIVAVYVVIVRLKLGGEEGIMREDAGRDAQTERSREP